MSLQVSLIENQNFMTQITTFRLGVMEPDGDPAFKISHFEINIPEEELVDILNVRNLVHLGVMQEVRKSKFFSDEQVLEISDDLMNILYPPEWPMIMDDDLYSLPGGPAGYFSVATGPPKPNINRIADKLPGMLHLIECPVSDCVDNGTWNHVGGKHELKLIIMFLNDTHKWTREQIADWLDTLDIDLGFKVE